MSTVTSSAATSRGKRPAVFWVPKLVMVWPLASLAVTVAVPLRALPLIWGLLIATSK